MTPQQAADAAETRVLADYLERRHQDRVLMAMLGIEADAEAGAGRLLGDPED